MKYVRSVRIMPVMSRFTALNAIEKKCEYLLKNIIVIFTYRVRDEKVFDT
jgi:hypothetical protein